MRITSLFIKNFKGIDGHGVRIDFAPITMLFGPNNAGKSTVIQALHLAREVLCHNNPDADRVEGGGESINLGGFKEFVHKHDLDKDVSIRLEIDLEGEDLPFRLDEMPLEELQKTGDLGDIVRSILNHIETISVQFTLSWGMNTQRAFVSDYAVFLGDTEIAAISSQESRPQLFMGINFSKLLSIDEQKSCEEQLLAYIRSADQEAILEDFALPKMMDTFSEIINFATTFDAIVPGSSDALGYGYDSIEIHTINPSIRGCALPLWDQPLDASNITDSKLAIAFLSSLLVGPSLLLRDFFQKRFQYIGPLRQIPPRNFLAAKTPTADRWANGLAAWDMLATANNAQLDTVNAWLYGPQSLNTGYSIRFQKLLPLKQDTALLNTLLMAVWEDSDDGAASLLREILNQPLETRLALYNEQSDVFVSPNDVGTGISQIIPVVVAAALAKPDTVIAIEQPELHIHPAWQTALGDLFISAITKEQAPMFLLETHSEHLMLRLLRRVRETHDDELPTGFQPITPEMISVLYVQAKEYGGTEIIPLPITPDGDFSHKWPNGFFAERAEELF